MLTEQLKKRLMTGTMDEVDLEMLKAKCKEADRLLSEACSNFCDTIHDLYERYQDELNLIHATVVAYHKDKFCDEGEFYMQCIDGWGKYIEEIRNDLNALETRHNEPADHERSND